MAVSLTGCPVMDNEYLPYPQPNFDEYEVRVQPIMNKSCANLGCHGTHDISLTLYAPGYLRAKPTSPMTPIDPDYLSYDELLWNYDALAMRILDEESADECRLLLKCLDPKVGGIEHADGTVVWQTMKDEDLQIFKEWIEGGL